METLLAAAPRYPRLRMVEMNLGVRCEGRPIPLASSSFTRLASELAGRGAG